MATRLAEVSFSEGAGAALEALATDGGVIVRDLLDAPLLERLRADMQAAAGAHRVGSVADSEFIRAFWGEQTMRFTRLAARSDAFFDLLAHASLLAVADALLLPNCGNYWLNTAQMIVLGPGQPGQDLHRDADNWPQVNRRDGFEITISTMIALDAFTEANGATQVVPGSHLWDDYDREPEPDEVTQAVMPAGSALLYTGRLVHGGGANRTEDEWRWGMHMSYVLGWLTPEEASPIGVPWDRVRDRPERIQQLLGWRCTTPPSHAAGRLWTVDYEDIPTALGLS